MPDEQKARVGYVIQKLVCIEREMAALRERRKEVFEYARQHGVNREAVEEAVKIILTPERDLREKADRANYYMKLALEHDDALRAAMDREMEDSLSVKKTPSIREIIAEKSNAR